MEPTETHRLTLIREFMYRSHSCIINALPKYGDFDSATDKRILSEKALDKILSSGSYLELLELKHSNLSPKIQSIRAKMILIYGMLKELKEDELSQHKVRE